MSPYVTPLSSPRTPNSSLPPPPAKRPKLESSSGNSWSVSYDPTHSSSSSRITQFVAANFDDTLPKTPPRGVSSVPASFYPASEEENHDDAFWLPSSSALKVLDDLERGPSKRKGHQSYHPLYPQRLNPNGLPKKPCRYRLESELEKLHPFLRNAIDVQSRSKFTWNDEVFRIEIQNDRNATGQFNIFATIAKNQPQIIKSKENHEIGLKTFRDHCIMVESGPDRVFKDSHLVVLDQYCDLQKNLIPVATIFNPVEAEEGCGFFLVEIVPTPFHVDWKKGTPIESLSNDQWNFLVQLKGIFKKSYQAGIIPDLKPDNLRVRSNGQLTITDLRERKVSYKYLDAEFQKMLCSFNCQEGDEIYNYLNPIPVAVAVCEKF